VVSMPSVVPSLQSTGQSQSHSLQSSSRSQSLPMDPNNGSIDSMTNSNLCATVITANGVEQQTV
jgi:hypothetical protein